MKTESSKAENKYPKTSKAAVLDEYHTRNTIREVTIPDIDANEILVKVLLAGICGSDVHQREGALSIQTPLPIIQGHEALGRIIKLGGERKTDVAGQPLKENDRIMWSHAYCGKCYFCKVLRKPYMCRNPQLYGYASPEMLCGGFSEYECVLQNAEVVRVPDELTDEEALGVGCAFRTVVNGFEKLQKHGGIATGDCVVIQGAGPVGLYSTVLAAQSGASRIIVIGAPANRLTLAKRWGATDTIDVDAVMEPEARLAMVLELTEGRGAQVAVECAGVPAAFNEGMDLLAKGGIYLVMGQTSTNPVEFSPNKLLAKQAVVLGSSSADITHYYRALKFIQRFRGTYPFAELITNTYKLEEINEALDNMQKGVDIKAAIDNRNR